MDDLGFLLLFLVTTWLSDNVLILLTYTFYSFTKLSPSWIDKHTGRAGFPFSQFLH